MPNPNKNRQPSAPGRVDFTPATAGLDRPNRKRPTFRFLHLASTIVLLTLAACGPGDPPESLHRFTRDIDPEDPNREIKVLYGVQYRNVLDAAHSTGYGKVALNDTGQILLTPFVDTESLHPNAIGINVVVESETSGIAATVLFKENSAPKTLASNRLKLFEPGPRPAAFSGNTADIFVSEILPFPRETSVPAVHVPPGAYLETAIGYGAAVMNREQHSGFRSEPQSGPGQQWRHPIRFSILADVNGRTEEIFEATRLQPPANDFNLRKWHEIRVDLARFAGKEVAFTFRAEDARDIPEESRRANPVLASPVWANPAVKADPARDEDRPPNVILIVLDTLRADRLGVYGHDQPTSPNIDKLAAESIVFEHCYAPTSWTLPSHSSLFTGLAPSLHGSGMLAGYGLLDRYTTLAERLRENGYLTAAFTEGYAVSGGLGLFQGFELYAHATPTRSEMPPPGTVRETFGHARDWIARNNPFPYFLFLHTYEIHHPYTAPPEILERFVDAKYMAGDSLPNVNTPEFFEPLRQTYDAGIAYTDSVLGELLDELEASGELDRSLLIITSDHGERLGEHVDFDSPFARVPHGTTLYDPVLHIPCIIRPPGGLDAPRRISAPVALTDIYATVLDVTGIGVADPALDSKSLVPWFDAEPPENLRRKHTTAELVHFGDNRHTKLAIQHEEWKYIVQARPTEEPIERSPGNPLSYDPAHMQRNGAAELLLLDLARQAMNEAPEVPLTFTHMLFNMEEDPRELNNLAGQNPEKTREMHALLTAEIRRMHLNAAESTGQQTYLELSPEDEEALRALGYIE